MRAEPDAEILKRWAAADAAQDSPARALWDDEWARGPLVHKHPHLALPWPKADDAMRRAWASWVLAAHRAAQRDLAIRR